MDRKLISAVLLAACAGVLLLLCTAQLEGDSALTGEIQNTGHTPVFGLLGLTMLGLSRSILGNRVRGSLRHYLLAFAVTVFIGAMIEFVQIFGPRDADVWDLVRDAAGACSFLGFYATIDPRFAAETAGRFKTAVRFVSLSVLLGALMPLIVTSGAYIHRNAVFPELLTFDSVWEAKFLTTRNADLSRVQPPEGFLEIADGDVGMLTVFPGTYCGFRIAEPCPDWSAYDALRFDIFSELDTTITLAVRIDDSHHNQEYEDRYNAVFEAPPGLTRISIDLEDVQYAPIAREMDMTAIWYVYVFTSNPERPVVLYIDNVELAE